MTQAATNLHDYLDAPGELCRLPGVELDHCDQREIEAFQLTAAQRMLARQADRIPAVAEVLDGRDPTSFERLDDFTSVLFDEDAYKSYDPTLVDTKKFDQLTQWLGRFTTHDLSSMKMDDCDTLTEWCRRLDEHAGIFVCHSSGTSGTLSFVPRSRRDRDLAVDELVYSNRHLFTPHGTNDVTLFALGPRRLYRITQAIYDGLEQRHGAEPVQALDRFHSPEFHVAQGRLRRAAAEGTSVDDFNDPIVAAYRDQVEQYYHELPELTKRWTENLMENYRGRPVLFQGSFDKAWRITKHFRNAGITAAFAPESTFMLTGGIKDGSTLPANWLADMKRATGVADTHLTSTWGMSEITGGVHPCRHGVYHFPLTIIPFLLEPETRRPRPRHGIQTGQIALLELNSDDCWGGLVSGDKGVIEWDSTCTCGRHGPLMRPESIKRL